MVLFLIRAVTAGGRGGFRYKRPNRPIGPKSKLGKLDTKHKVQKAAHEPIYYLNSIVSNGAGELELARACEEMLDNSLNEVMRIMRTEVPVRTGALKASIARKGEFSIGVSRIFSRIPSSIIDIRRRREISVTPTEDYARFVVPNHPFMLNAYGRAGTAAAATQVTRNLTFTITYVGYIVRLRLTKIVRWSLPITIRFPDICTLEYRSEVPEILWSYASSFTPPFRLAIPLQI